MFWLSHSTHQTRFKSFAINFIWDSRKVQLSFSVKLWLLESKFSTWPKYIGKVKLLVTNFANQIRIHSHQFCKSNPNSNPNANQMRMVSFNKKALLVIANTTLKNWKTLVLSKNGSLVSIHKNLKNIWRLAKVSTFRERLLNVS